MQNSSETEDILQIVEENLGMHRNVGIDCRKRRFLVSDVRDQNFFEELNEKVQDLGGHIVKTDVFVSGVNNVLARNFTACEKILGALAAGHWILKVEYIIESHKAGHWLNREDYEWQNCDEVAKYCRLRRKRSGWGMFIGRTVCVHIASGKRRSFTRIIRGGGGSVCSVKDLKGRSLDFVLVEKNLVEEAWGLVGPDVPLVNLEYISETLLMKKDPRDIKPYIIDTQKIIAESRLMDDVHQDNACVRGPDMSEVAGVFSQGIKKQVSETGPLSLKRPYVTGEVARKGEETFSRQPSLENFFPYFKVPVKSRSDSPNNTPKKKRNKKYEFPSEKYMDIRNFCKRKDLSAKRTEFVDSDDSDIVVVSEPSIVTCNRFDCSVANLQNLKVNNEELSIGQTDAMGFLDKKTEEKENVYGPSSLTRVSSESSGHARKVNGVSELDEQPYLQETSFFDVDERATNNIDETHITLNQIMKNNSEKAIKGLGNLCLKPIAGIEENIKDGSSFRIVSTVSNMNQKICNEIKKSHRREMISSLECLEISDIGKELQTGEPGISSQMSSSIESSSTPSSGGLHFTSADIKSAIMTFVKKQRTSCSTLTKLVQPCYPSRSEVSVVVLDDSVDSPVKSSQTCEPEEVCEELVLEEMAFFEESTDEDITGARILDTTDEETMVDGIESLLLHISIRKYPPAWAMGRLLSQLAWKVDSKFVHQRALHLAYQILSLHPPSSTQRRAYYYNVLSFGMQTSEDHHNRAWLFIQDVINSALALKRVAGETPNEAHRANELLQFILTLLQQDFIMWNRSCQNVFSLITTQLLWEEKGNLNFVTQNIKDLMKLWVDSINSPPDVQSYVGGLMSLLLEIVIAGTNTIPAVADHILHTAYIPQITSYIQYLDMSSKIKLVCHLSSPWVRSYVFRNLLCKTHHESSQKLAETDLKALLHKLEKVEFVSQAETDGTILQVSSRKRKNQLPVRVPIQQEDYSKLLVAAVNNYVSHMCLMGIYSHLCGIAQGKKTRSLRDWVLVKGDSHEEQDHEVVEKLFPIIKSDLAVVLNSKHLICRHNLPSVQDMLMFSLSR